MAQVFISYRREDTASGYSKTLSDGLRQRLGHDEVFRDIHSIGPGESFPAAIEAALNECRVCLVLIGSMWLAARTRDGTPRIHEPDDWVRHEVALALVRPDVLVIPVLVSGSTMPHVRDLPEDLGDLASLNAYELRDRHFDHDLDVMLVELIRNGFIGLSSRAPFRKSFDATGTRRQHARWRTAAAALLAGALAGWAGTHFMFQPSIRAATNRGLELASDLESALAERKVAEALAERRLSELNAAVERAAAAAAGQADAEKRIGALEASLKSPPSGSIMAAAQGIVRLADLQREGAEAYDRGEIARADDIYDRGISAATVAFPGGSLSVALMQLYSARAKAAHGEIQAAEGLVKGAAAALDGFSATVAGVTAGVLRAEILLALGQSANAMVVLERTYLEAERLLASARLVPLSPLTLIGDGHGGLWASPADGAPRVQAPTERDLVLLLMAGMNVAYASALREIGGEVGDVRDLLEEARSMVRQMSNQVSRALDHRLSVRIALELADLFSREGEAGRAIGELNGALALIDELAVEDPERDLSWQRAVLRISVAALHYRQGRSLGDLDNLFHPALDALLKMPGSLSILQAQPALDYLLEKQREGGSEADEELFRLISKIVSNHYASGVARSNRKFSHNTDGASAAGAASPMLLEEAQDRLATDELLVTFFVDQTATYVFALTRQRLFGYRVERGAEELRRTILRYREPMDGDFLTAMDLDIGHALYSDLFGPITRVVEKIRHVIIVPTGPLLRLPFHMLLTAPPASQVEIVGADKKHAYFDYSDVPWLIRRNTISVSLTLSGFLASRTIRASQASHSLIGYGFPGEPSKIDVTTNIPLTLGHSAFVDALLERRRAPKQCSPTFYALQLLSSLPETRDELESIRSILGPDNAELHVGDAFTDTAVKAANLKNFRVLHFATHHLLPRDPTCLPHPALLTSFSDDGDALLEPPEIRSLDLDAELVVLSACDTASLGDARTADSIAKRSRLPGLLVSPESTIDLVDLSIIDSFFHAGARTIIGAAWSVDAVVPHVLFEHFYSALRRDPELPVAAALRCAQLDLIDESVHSHPFFWAPYQVFGDGARSPRLAGGTSTAAAASANCRR